MDRKHKGICCTLVAPVALTSAGARAENHDHGNHAPMSPPAMRMNAQEGKMLIDTISEEKTEINTLTAQQAELRKRGGAKNLKTASLLGRMVADHKGVGPTMMALARKHGADPKTARIMKPPILGSLDQMLQVDMKDHMAVEKTSDMRRSKSNDPAVKAAMQNAPASPVSTCSG